MSFSRFAVQSTGESRFAQSASGTANATSFAEMSARSQAHPPSGVARVLGRQQTIDPGLAQDMTRECSARSVSVDRFKDGSALPNLAQEYCNSFRVCWAAQSAWRHAAESPLALRAPALPRISYRFSHLRKLTNRMSLSSISSTSSIASRSRASAGAAWRCTGFAPKPTNVGLRISLASTREWPSVTGMRNSAQSRTLIFSCVQPLAKISQRPTHTGKHVWAMHRQQASLRGLCPE